MYVSDKTMFCILNVKEITEETWRDRTVCITHVPKTRHQRLTIKLEPTKINNGRRS